MLTLLWKRERTVYRIVVDGSEEILNKLLELDCIERSSFKYRKMRVPVKMRLGELAYDLYSLKKGAPKW